MVEKRRHIDDEISEHREGGERFDESGSFQKVLDMSSAGQHQFTIDFHGARTTNSTATGISESKGPILLVLKVQQGLQEIHPLSNFYLKSFDPPRRIFLFLKTFNP
jgi:hypothetical protein